MDVYEDLNRVRNQICDWVLIISVIFGVPACLGSLSRWQTIGWHWVIGLHCTFTLILVGVALFRHRIPYNARAGFLVFAGLFMGITGLWKFGFLSSSIPLIIIAPILAAILFGNSVAIGSTAVFAIAATTIAMAFTQGEVQLSFDVQAYLELKPAWLNFILVSLLAMAIPITANYMIQRHLLTALKHALRNKKQLEKMVADRTWELEQAKCAAERLARIDELTGLYNRRAFMECAELVHGQSLRHGHSYVVLMMDLDFFKKINDTWGHRSGDAVLRTFGYFLRTRFRSTDIVGRVGGEEFAVMLPETGINEAQELAETLRKKIEKSGLHTPSGQLSFTCSVGIAELNLKHPALEETISSADEALYAAKANGRNQVFYSGSAIENT